MLPVTVAVAELVTDTMVEADAVQPATLVTVTEYVPDIASVAPVMTGFCVVELKPSGPLHKYEEPPDEFKLMVPPMQAGPLLPAVADAAGPTVTVAEQVAVLLLASLTVNTTVLAPVVLQLNEPGATDNRFTVPQLS